MWGMHGLNKTGRKISAVSAKQYGTYRKGDRSHTHMMISSRLRHD